MNITEGELFSTAGGGVSAIYGPDGRTVPTNKLAPEEEGIIYGDLDMSEILNCKALLDTVGHYSRPDLLWLGVDYQEKKCVRSV